MTATFRGTVALTDVVIGERCRIVGAGMGQPADFVTRGGDFVPIPGYDGTRLS